MAQKLKIGKIDVKLFEILNPMLGNALSALMQKEVSAKTAFAMIKIIDERAVHIKDFEAAKKLLLEQYCDKDDMGGFLLNESKTEYLVRDKPEFEKKVNDLTQVEIQMTNLDKADIEKLSSITAGQLIALKPVIKE